MPRMLVFDAKGYDREYLGAAAEKQGADLDFREFRLDAGTARIAQGSGARAACIFVNDVADRDALGVLSEAGVRHLALRCAGFNNVDRNAASEFGMAVTRVPNYSPHAVAEHAVALLLSLIRKIPRAYTRVRDFNFSLSGLVGFDLHGKTAGIVGAGKIGRITAGILRGFGMRVLVEEPYPDTEWARGAGVELTDRETVLRESDVLSLHVPLTPETSHMIDATALGRMKDGVILLNVSRGRLVDTQSLIHALKDGKVGGVALDVYEEEEGVFFEDLSGEVLQNDELARLLSFPNVLVTAHQGFLTREALVEIARVTLENAVRLSSGGSALEGTAL